MQMFIPSVLSALQALFKCSHWLLWKVIKVFIYWKKSILLQRPPPNSSPSHDFSGIGSQGGSLPLYHQVPPSRPAGSYFTATSQSADYQPPLQSNLPRPQSDAILHPTVTTSVVHPYTPVIRPVEHIESSPPLTITALPVIELHEDQTPPRFELRREIISTRQRSGQGENLISPDAPVAEPAQVESTPLPLVITTTPLVIGPHEDYASPCLELRHERLGMKGPSHQSENLLPLDAPVTGVVEYIQQSPPLSITVPPVVEHEDRAPPPPGTSRRKSKRARRRSQQSESLVLDALVTTPTYTDTQPLASTTAPEAQVVVPLVINSSSDEDHESPRLMWGRSQRSEELVSDALVSKSVTSTHPSRIPLETDTYLSLRGKARQERNNMRKCFSKSEKAKARNNHKLAEKLVQNGEAHRENMVLFNKEASIKIYQEKNQKRKRNIIDLHRQHVPDAKSYFEKAVEDAQDRKESSLLVIVGKGNHSDDGPKIKPAILSLGQSLPGITIKVHSTNAGCLVVSFNCAS